MITIIHYLLLLSYGILNNNISSNTYQNALRIPELKNMNYPFFIANKERRIQPLLYLNFLLFISKFKNIDNQYFFPPWLRVVTKIFRIKYLLKKIKIPMKLKIFKKLRNIYLMQSWADCIEPFNQPFIIKHSTQVSFTVL